MKKTKVYSCIAIFCLSILCIALSIPANAYSIWMNGGNKGTYLHFYAWSGFTAETKHQFDLGFDEWNYNAGAVKPSSLWIDRSGTDTNQTTAFVNNNKNEITKGNRGTGDDSYLMATYRTSYVYEGGKYKLVEVDIDINGSYPWSNEVQSGTFFVQNAFTHEVGHVYGLGDVYSYTGVKPTMYGRSNYADNSQCSIEADDKAGLRYIYGGN